MYVRFVRAVHLRFRAGDARIDRFRPVLCRVGGGGGVDDGIDVAKRAVHVSLVGSGQGEVSAEDAAPFRGCQRHFRFFGQGGAHSLFRGGTVGREFVKRGGKHIPRYARSTLNVQSFHCFSPVLFMMCAR